jgi:predicted cobalt transporter CbtA
MIFKQIRLSKGGNMLGGIGLIIAIAVFFSWRKSAKNWQRVLAWIAAAWAMVSMLFYIYYFLSFL